MSVPPVEHRDFMGRGLGTSSAVHLLAFGGLWWMLVVRVPALREVELDLTQAPRAVSPLSRRAAPRPQVKSWTAPTTGLAPAPDASTETVESDDPVPACPPPCPDTPGDFVPAALAAAKPRWVGGFITDDDYPKISRQKGQDGSVLLAVYIDAAGTVRDVRLLKGSYDALNSVAVDKLKRATFEPARDESGRPIPAKLILPIRFELR